MDTKEPISHAQILSAVAAQGEAIRHLAESIKDHQADMQAVILRLSSAEVKIGQGQILMVALSVVSPILMALVLAISVPVVSSLVGVHVRVGPAVEEVK